MKKKTPYCRAILRFVLFVQRRLTVENFREKSQTRGPAIRIKSTYETRTDIHSKGAGRMYGPRESNTVEDVINGESSGKTAHGLDETGIGKRGKRPLGTRREDEARAEEGVWVKPGTDRPDTVLTGQNGRVENTNF